MISLLLPLLAASPCSSTSADVLALEGELAARVSAERCAREVHALVELGTRMGGTHSGDRAAAHLAEAFGEAGLAVRTIEDPELDAWEAHSFRVAATAAATDELEAETLVLERAWPYLSSPSAEGGAALSLEPAEGAAWLSERGPSRRKAPEGPALGLVDGRTTRDGSWPMPGRLSTRSEPRFPVFGVSGPEGERLRGWLAAGRAVTVEFALESESRRAPSRTVVATLPAREGAEPGYLLFCAHGDSDSGGPGADDNASGEAVVLEIARAWSGAVRDGLLPPPPREVRFAIWGAEMHSTRHYLETVVPEGPPILGVVNFDQAGFGSGADQVNVEPDDLPANLGLVRAIVGVLADHAGEDGFPEHFATNKSLGGTDSYVFSGSRRFREGGLPALTVFSSAWDHPEEHPRTPGMPGESWSDRDKVSVDYDVYYHSAGDRPETTTDREPYNMPWCARAAWLGARRWLEGL